MNALVADASADEDEETAPLREVVRDSGADERRALYAARAGEAGAALRRLQPAVAVDPGKAASKLKYAETQYEANKQFAPGLLRPVKGVKACKPKDASIDKVFCNPPRLRAPGILGDTMEDWSVIYKCGAQDGIRGMCKAIWCGTVTDGIKGIICDVRACAFYKDPLCTEGPDARIRPIAIGCALRRLCCKAGTCDLAPEWNRYYTTMHPDDAAEWEADHLLGRGRPLRMRSRRRPMRRRSTRQTSSREEIVERPDIRPDTSLSQITVKLGRRTQGTRHRRGAA